MVTKESTEVATPPVITGMSCLTPLWIVLVITAIIFILFYFFEILPLPCFTGQASPQVILESEITNLTLEAEIQPSILGFHNHSSFLHLPVFAMENCSYSSSSYFARISLCFFFYTEYFLVDPAKESGEQASGIPGVIGATPPF